MKGYKSFWLLLNIGGLNNFSDFATGWVTIINLGFAFNGPGLDTVILILFMGGVNIKVSNINNLILRSSSRITLINY